MQYNLKAFGQGIKSIRETLGYSVSQVSLITGVHRNTLNNVESGKTLPSISTLDMLSIAYKRDVYQMFSQYRVLSLNIVGNFEDKLIKALREFDYAYADQIVSHMEQDRQVIKEGDVVYLDHIIKKFKLYIASIQALSQTNLDQLAFVEQKLIEALEVENGIYSDKMLQSASFSMLDLYIMVRLAIVFRYQDKFNESIKVLEAAETTIENFKGFNEYVKLKLLIQTNMIVVKFQKDSKGDYMPDVEAMLKLADQTTNILALGNAIIYAGISRLNSNPQDTELAVLGLQLLKHSGHQEAYQIFKGNLQRDFKAIT